MTPQDLALQIFEIVSQYAAQNELVSVVESADDIALERPKSRDHGDWASSVSLKLAKPWGMNPRELAISLAEKISEIEGVDSADVAGPGFINLRLDSSSAGAVVSRILDEGESFGTGSRYLGVSFNLEFVSANPTGPIHLGGTRWAAVGDALARVLQSQGADVTREYYFNDHGAQIDRFSRSLLASFLGESAPEDGYGGAYIHDIAQRVVLAYAHDLSALPREEAEEVFRSIGVELMFGDIKSSLHDFGVDFDVYFHEQSLHQSGAVERALGKLKANGHVFEQDGATWLRTTDFGDDKDRVIIKSDGNAAYIAGDLAYYLDKRERGFERNLIMLGADHHGYVARLMAMCAAFGDVPGVNLEILIGQMVNLVKDGEPVRMSKRAGTVVTLEDFVDAVGVDAARYSLVRSSNDSKLDIDLGLLSRQTNENPVFYVQYAHARTCAVARNADVAGVSLRDGFDVSLFEQEVELELLGMLADFPRIVKQAADLREPHRIARYLELIAGGYHRWYDSCRVIPRQGEDISDVHTARLALNLATKQVLKSGLTLLGVSSPERM